MSEKLPRNDYLLAEAFQVVGRHLFAHEWTGDELIQIEIESPEEAHEARALIEAKLADCALEIQAVEKKIGQPLPTAEMEVLKRASAEAVDRRSELRLALLQLVTPEAVKAPHAAYLRKKAALASLTDALKASAITAHNGRRSVIDGDLWRGERHFGFILELSLARLPRERFPRRLQLVWIDIGELEKWLKTVKPQVASKLPPPTPEEDCEKFLEARVAEGNPDQLSKADWRDIALKEIDGLTGRGFNRAWVNTEMPNSWKSSGRKRGTDKSKRSPLAK